MKVPRRPAGEAVPPLTPTRAFVRTVLVTALALGVALVVQLVIVSGVQERAAQAQAFDALRLELATGTAPIGPTDESGALLAMGTPIAYLEIPKLDLHQVVAEGTTGSVLFDGPGHRRDTPLPGQVGTSVVMGRRAAFGGPFADLDTLRTGDKIVVTTGQGVFDFEVVGVRRDGDPVPARPAADASRLTLVTAAGSAFLPNGGLRVDAQLTGDAVGGARRPFSASSLPREEGLMAGDSSTLWALVLWLQALVLLAIGAVWAWQRWGRAYTWIVFLPTLLLVGLAASGEAFRLLPNLM